MDPDFVYERIPRDHAVFVPSLRYAVIRAIGIEPESIEGRESINDTFYDAVRGLVLEARVRTRLGFYDRRTPPIDNPLFLTSDVPLEMYSWWPVYRTVERTTIAEEPAEAMNGVLAYAGETLKNENR